MHYRLFVGLRHRRRKSAVGSRQLQLKLVACWLSTPRLRQLDLAFGKVVLQHLYGYEYLSAHKNVLNIYRVAFWDKYAFLAT